MSFGYTLNFDLVKLGHDPIYLRVIGRVQGVHSIQVHYVHGVTDKPTAILRAAAIAGGRSNNMCSLAQRYDFYQLDAMHSVGICDSDVSVHLPQSVYCV